MKTTITTLLILLAAAAAALAQDPREPLPGHSLHGEGFSEGPRRRLPLIPGCGDVHIQVTTSCPEAQQYFDQGVGQLHGFWYWEAERSFRTVRLLDPDCAMAHWGLAMANVENEPRARAFLEDISETALEQATPREKAWIEAAKKLFGVKDAPPVAAPQADPQAVAQADGANPPDPPKETDPPGETDEEKKARRRAFTEALETIALDHPDDVEPRAFSVGHAWINKGKGLEISSRLAVDALGRQVLDRNPRHPVHHYVIHLWDHDRAKEALHSAAACGPSAPGIAHMWHMPGHIYSGLERWHDAAWQQEAAARVDHAQMARAHVFPDQIHNFAHNSEWLIRNLNHVGRVDDAVDIAVNMIAMPRIARSREVKPDPEQSFKEEGSCWQFGRDRLFETILRWEAWETAARLADTPALEPGPEFDDRWQREQLLAIAAYGRNDVAAGDAALARLVAIEAEERAGRTAAADDAEAKARGEGKPPAEITTAMAEAMRPFSERIEKLQGPLAEARLLATIATGSLDQAREQRAALSDHVRNGIDKARLAMITLTLGDTDKALELASAHADSAKTQLQPQAILAYVQWQAGNRDEALATFQRVRTLAAAADPELPALARLAPLAEAAGIAGDWRIPATPADDIGERPDLDSLGPRVWRGWQAGSWTATSSTGEPVTSGTSTGRPHVILLTLGMACEHCNEQVKAFSEAASRFEAAGLPVIVISTDPAQDVAASAESLPFTALSAADGEAFRALDAWDDFENMPLHATCYVSADGRMRWQHVGYEPFMLPEFLLDEIRRLEASPESLR